MKIFSALALIALGCTSAFADNASIECNDPAQRQAIRLELDEVSDISAKSAHLTVNSKTLKVLQIGVTRNDYGVLSINAAAKLSFGKYNYLFRNLGSKKCFSVYDSGQKGRAVVDVINGLGVIATVECKCSVD